MDRFLKLVLCVVIVLVANAVGQEDDYSSLGGYEDTYDDLQDIDPSYEQDTYGYYQDDEAEYYEYYGIYDDQQQYEDYFADMEYEDDLLEDCVLGNDGKPVLKNGTITCDVKLTGVDKTAKSLPGGVDGVYKLVSCYHGKPLYKRQDSAKGEERTIWYSYDSGDWDISRGSQPNKADILMYGDERENAVLPLAVQRWSVMSLSKPTNGSARREYAVVAASLVCADGTKLNKQQLESMVEKPKLMLSENEIEKKYAYIYDHGAKRDPTPSVNFTVVVLMVMTGLTCVLAIPYFLLGKRRRGGKQAQPFAGSLAQAILASKKKQSGRAN